MILGRALLEYARHVRTPIALFLFCPIFTWAATYHVSTAGNDFFPGTAAQPWATLQHAVDRISAGDTILIAAGS